MAAPTAVGLFAGAGGLDLGAKKAGFKMVFACDNDDAAMQTYRRNVSDNFEKVDLSDPPLQLFPTAADLLLGGPPCQGFSSAGPKQEDDARNTLWRSYVRVLKHVMPKAFILENVTGFLREFQDFNSEIQQETRCAYNIYAKNLNAQFYGIPQHRIRFFLVGVRKDLNCEFDWPTPKVPEVSNQRRTGGWTVVPGMVSMKEALQSLGPSAPISDLKQKDWGTPHAHIPLEPAHAEAAPFIPNGGSLRSVPNKYLPNTYKGRERTRKGWAWYYRKPNPLLPARTITASIGPCFSTILAPDVEVVGSGGAWEWKVIDPADFTSASGAYRSPLSQRRLTIKECARIQTFPDDFEFFGSAREKHKLIGNAVPVELSRRLCEAVLGCI